MPLWLLLAPRIVDVAISRGVQEVKNLGPEENGRKFFEDADGADGGWTGGWADVGQRRGGRADGTENGGGRADERTGG